MYVIKKSESKFAGKDEKEYPNCTEEKFDKLVKECEEEAAFNASVKNYDATVTLTAINDGEAIYFKQFC